MDCIKVFFIDVNVWLVIKYVVDREQFLNMVLVGLGQFGNDYLVLQIDRFFNLELLQCSYDLDKVKFYVRQVGLDLMVVMFLVLEVVFFGVVDVVVVFCMVVLGVGIDVLIKCELVDGYWLDVWMQVLFCMFYWGGCLMVDQMLIIVYEFILFYNDM